MIESVIKSDGRKEAISLDKLTKRIQKVCKGLQTQHVSPVEITRRVAEAIVDGITTHQIDELIAHESARMVTLHPDYGLVASRILATRLHKTAPKSWSSAMQELYLYCNPKTGQHSPQVNERIYQLATNPETASLIDQMIQPERDLEYDYFGFTTLLKGYLRSLDGVTKETPQYLWMRVAVAIHDDDLESVRKVYDQMSQGLYTHATPTLFNAGTTRQQMSSCYLQALEEDSIEGIFNTYKDLALVSKWAGGIGLHLHNLRAKNTLIAGTGGKSDGVVPFLRVLNEIARYVNQGGKRKGAIAVYMEPWHADIEEFLEMKKNHGKEEMRARDLYYALWIPDLFMERVRDGGMWSLMCPHICPGLSDVYGDDFKALYEQYEAEGRYVRQVKASDLWIAAIKSQIETGVPYVLFKDAINRKSNQKNIGVIKSSNLCAEIAEVSTPDETAVCNLASIALPKFVQGQNVDYEALRQTSRQIAINLNKLIDKNYYPTPQTSRSNLRHRPIGIGVQGLADLFLRLKTPFDSPRARELNRKIFATILYGAMEGSVSIAEQDGPYDTFEGSPLSQGKFQFDLWGVDPDPMWDWEGLRQKVMQHGVRNSLLLAPMPTASTSQILGNNECFEPYTSNLYVRRVLSGEFIVVNRHLVEDLIRIGMWNENVKNDIILAEGSVQTLDYLPQDLKDRYRTVWEIPQRSVIDMAADRGAYVCQTQSMNLFLATPTIGQVNSMLFYAWNKGLKTGMYYLRSKPSSKAKKITVEAPTVETTPVVSDEEALVCSLQNPEACAACSA